MRILDKICNTSYHHVVSKEVKSQIYGQSLKVISVVYKGSQSEQTVSSWTLSKWGEGGGEVC